MSAKLMGEIAKFFSGGKSGPKALLLAYAKFGKDAVNKYFKERKPSYNMKIDNKNVGGMAEAMEKGAKSQFKTKPETKIAEKKSFVPPKVGKGGPVKVIQIDGKFYKVTGNKMEPIKGLDAKKKKANVFKNGGMASKRTSRRAGIAKRGFNNFKGIF